MNQPQWGQAVGERLMFMVNTKVQAASMILNPPELGPIEVRVNINQDQASVQFVSSHAAVRDAIEEAFPKLRDMFAQNGLSLADANVSQHSEQQQRYDQAASDAGIQNEAGVVETEEAASADVITRINGIGLVDQYV